jgi:hypothetical protein
MNRPPGGSSSSDVARGASFAVAKGAALIGLAVIIGLVLLQQVDNHSSKAAVTTTPTTKRVKTTTTVAAAGTTTTTSSVPAAPAKTPAQLRLIVLNGGAKAGDAARMASKLKTKGYTNQADANNWSKHTQTGNTVLCRAGHDQEAVTLAVAVGNGTPVPIQPFPTPPPTYSDGPPPVDCVVAVGG